MKFEFQKCLYGVRKLLLILFMLSVLPDQTAEMQLLPSQTIAYTGR